ncbi:MAG TPA: hypothetical protein VJ783_05010 [Pirellulales bacterium]|nr:hypothetical protein [Pirellulales bacterium]
MNDRERTSHLARLVLAVFVLTFVISRVLVLLIMTHRIPDLFLHLGGTHVHHLNYGIFLLSGVGAYLIFVRPTGRSEDIATVVYGIGLGLTFDEFGMWLHLGGPYWQRASFDAVVIIAALLGLIAAAPELRRFKRRHWLMLAAIAAALSVFVYLAAHWLQTAVGRMSDELQKIETESPP